MSFRHLLVTLLAIFSLASCANNPAIKEAREHLDAGRSEDGLGILEKATRENPENNIYRSEYFRQRELVVALWLAQADTLKLAGQHEAATIAYRRIQKHDPQNVRARVGLAELEVETRHRVIIANTERLIKESKYVEARDTLRPLLNENPSHRDARRLQRDIDEKTLKPAITTPRIKTTSKQLSLELRDVSLRSVLDVIAESTGLSFIFDKDIRSDLRTSIAIRNSSPEDLIRMVLSSNQLDQKLINETTILVYPNTPQKQREYQELVIRTFYLTNAEVKQTATMIRTLLKTRDVFIDEKLNMLVIKDTPNTIRMAEMLVAAHDLADPEIMLEVEVLEVGSTRLLDLGLRFPDSVAWSLVGEGSTTAAGTGTVTTATTSGGTPGVLSLSEWIGRNAGLVRMTVTNPAFLLSLRQQDVSTNVLANPRIRVKSKDKAKIHIGDRVPVITTTAGAVGGFISESVSYLDVGLKVEVEPVVHLGDEISIKVGLEVSNIAREIRSSTSNTLTYQVGTRNVSTALRLKDGETQILAGLINDEDRRTTNRVPGIGSLPIVGRLFSDTHETRGKTEIVLLITPRLVRTLERPGNSIIEFSAGTEASAGGAPTITPGALSPTPGTLTPTPAATPAAAQPAAATPARSPIVPFGGLQRSTP